MLICNKLIRLNKITFLFLIVFILSFSQCAKKGRPSGGPKDVDAPLFVTANPPYESINFDKNEIDIYFDEYIKLKNLNDQLIISPPLNPANPSLISPQGTPSKNINIKILDTLFIEHPYEEVAYEILKIENLNQDIGSGLFGKLKIPMKTNEFLKHLKKVMKTDCIRYTKLNKEYIETVAVCGGSGSFLINDAKKVKADIFITGDFKYHEFFDAENDIIIADIGHYESEQFTKDLISDILKKKFTKFATHLSTIKTNPINYL